MRRSGPLHPTDRIFYTWHFLPAGIARVIVGEYGRCTKAVSGYSLAPARPVHPGDGVV